VVTSAHVRRWGLPAATLLAVAAGVMPSRTPQVGARLARPAVLSAAASRSALDASASAALSAGLASAFSRSDLPGAVVLVVNRDGLLFHEAVGKLDVARGLAMPKDALFRIASMTKPVTSLVVMQLVDEGKLRLADPVSKYLPAWSTPKVVTAVDGASGKHETRTAARAITIQHLLTHTSGLGYAWSNPQLAMIQKTSGLADLDLPLVHEPGDRFTYGASTRVLGHVVERITGQSIDAALETRVFGPLQMRDTSFAVPADKHSRLVTVHQRTSGRFVEQPNPAAHPATVRGDGGLVSTASDYGRFVRMFLNEGVLEGRRVASAGAIREMTRNHLGVLKVERQPAADTARSKPYPLGAGADTWGLGFQLAAKPASRTARSEGSYSWAGINNTHFWVDPGRQIGVIVLMQVLPFYDESAIALLTEIETLVNTHVK
jgi:methyl acetate hydrolase